MALSYVRSVLAADAVGELVGDAYGLGVTGAELVRSLVNDVYAIETDDGRHALKLYRQVDAPRAWSFDEVRWEQQLVGELLRSGLRVPTPVALLNGGLVGRLDAPEGLRPFVLTRWIPGSKPVPPPSDDLYRSFGMSTAQFHTAAQGLVSPVVRRPVDPVEELPNTAEEVVVALEDVDDRALVQRSTEWAGRQLEGLVPSGMTWGVRHGDVSLDNVLETDGELSLHDFDRAGPGWLAADLTGVRATDHWPAFLAGYTESRGLTPEDLRAIPALQVVALIANLRFHLVDKPLVFGSESRGEGWVDRELASLRDLLST